MKITKKQLLEMVTEEMSALDEAGDTASMTRQHYQLIANVLRRNKDHGSWETIVSDFAAELANTNPRFDEEKFLDASGANPNKQPTTRPRNAPPLPEGLDEETWQARAARRRKLGVAAVPTKRIPSPVGPDGLTWQARAALERRARGGDKEAQRTLAKLRTQKAK
jgi:hypothetical protein